jgi:hypothetical protein
MLTSGTRVIFADLSLCDASSDEYAEGRSILTERESR